MTIAEQLDLMLHTTAPYGFLREFAEGVGAPDPDDAVQYALTTTIQRHEVFADVQVATGQIMAYIRRAAELQQDRREDEQYWEDTMYNKAEWEDQDPCELVIAGSSAFARVVEPAPRS